MNGSKMLKVCGILNIIFGGIALISSFILVTGISIVVAFTGVTEGVYVAAIIVSIVGAIAELVAGILGVANWKKPEKAQLCIAFGVIVIVLTILSAVLTIVSGATFGGTMVISVIFGLALPVLYLIGALQLKKMACGASSVEGPKDAE